MAQTMKAAVVHEFKQPLAIDEEAGPVPEPGQILVKIAARACATPTCTPRTATGRSPSAALHPGPRGRGHRRRPRRRRHGGKEGDRVGVPWLHTACGHCKYRLLGQTCATPRRTPVMR